MKLFLFFSLLSISIFADGENLKSAYVDYDAFEKIVAEVKEHRKNRLVSLEKFLEMSKEDKVII
ncbi:MAG TPA: hypothetical protein PLS71_23865, partial [Leptospiraceae bacterium]|nr:hypothetical protein [Leptospiraceae bacterium]